MPSKLNEEPQEDPNAVETQTQEVVTREITATDKINKYLLQSLLVRMNQSDESLKNFQNEEVGGQDIITLILKRETTNITSTVYTNNIMDSPEPDNFFDEDLEEELPLQQNEAEEVPETTEEPKTVKPKRDVKKQVILNENTLRGKRGLTALPSYFERVQFKGKGHEEQDLGAILKTYEYWCYRLFPRRPFDDCVNKIEKLGSRRIVQTYIKRIRFDLVQEDEENLQNNIINDVEDDEVAQNVLLNDFTDDNRFEDQHDQVVQIHDQFDQLIATRVDNDFNELINTQLTADQEERIQQNKQKAEQLRREKLQRQVQSVTIQPSATATINTLQELLPNGTNDQLDSVEDNQASENQHRDFSLSEAAVTILASQESLFSNESNQDAVIVGEESNDSGKLV